MSARDEFGLLCEMQRIRLVEEEIANRYHENKMRCPTHLSIGQEAVAVAVGTVVNSNDFAVSTHRAHAHYLAKGGSLRAMIAEIYGKATGCSRGKGGSMHLIDLKVNFMGTSPIVGNSIPIGVGLALSSKLKGTDQISCVFLGDGAIEEGVFYESVNFAAVKKLPVLFICENNLYSVYSPLSVRQPKGRGIAKMVNAMGIKAASGKGADILMAHQMIQEAINQIRAGSGPQFLEFSTYRWREHCGHDYDNHIGYRTQEEFDKWKSLDPLDCLDNALSHEHIVVKEKIDVIKSQIKKEIQIAFDKASSAPFPLQHDAYQNIYAEQA